MPKKTNLAKSSLADEAIDAYVESDEWQLAEIRAAQVELDGGQEVSHETVSEWLHSWGKRGETNAPR